MDHGGSESRLPVTRRHHDSSPEQSSGSSYELDTLRAPTEGSLFPDIVYDPHAPSQPNKWSDVHSNTQSVISIIDDAASSVCLDDIGVPLEDVAKTIYKNTTHKNLGDVSSNASATTPISPAGFSHPGVSDFDEYNQRTAAQVLASKRIDRRNNRQLRRRLRQQRQELLFGNYFNNPNLDSLGEGRHPHQQSGGSNSTLRVSYNVDHFNGHRQNENYNHQLNIMFAKKNNLRMNRNTLDLMYNRENNGLSIITSGASYMTDNLDDMSSSDGRNSDDVFDDDETSSISSFSDTNEPNAENKWFPRKGLKRRLMSRHLSSTAFAGAIGVSSMLAMGQVLFASGPLGALLGFIIAGIIVYSVLVSYGEMVSFLPLHTGIPGVICRFVDPSMGTAIGFCYWFSNAIALPLELTAAAMMLTDYEELSEPGVAIVWIIVILIIVLMVNLCNASIYGEFQFIASVGRVLLIFSLSILLILINRGLVSPQHGVIGFRYWTYSKSDFDSGLIYGPFRQVLPVHVLFKQNTNEINIWGIPGAVGRFLQVWQAIIAGARSLMGSDMMFASVGEARNPRRSLAQGTKWIFRRIIFFYILAIFLFGITIYAGDSNLINLGTLKKVDDTGDSNMSVGIMVTSVQHQHESCNPNYWMTTETLKFNSIPWIVALQTVGMCSAAAGINAAFVIFAISAGSAQLYASSRTLYGLFRMHVDERKIKHTKKWWLLPGCTNSSGVPVCAMLLSFPFAFLAFLTTHTSSFMVFNLLIYISSTAGMIAWAGMALAFLRFFAAIKANQKAHTSRDSYEEQPPAKEYISRDDIAYPFRSPFQPYTAFLGLFGCILIVATQGYLVFLRTNWNLNLFVASYISPVLFAVVYVTHKLLTRSKMTPINKIDLDSGRREMERAGWAEDRKYGFNFYEWVRAKWSVITGNRYHRKRERPPCNVVVPPEEEATTVKGIIESTTSASGTATTATGATGPMNNIMTSNDFRPA